MKGVHAFICGGVLGVVFLPFILSRSYYLYSCDFVLYSFICYLFLQNGVVEGNMFHLNFILTVELLL